MFLYLHGFNSSGASAKGKFFTQALAPIFVDTPSYPPSPDAAITSLQQRIEMRLSQHGTGQQLTLIGSSLGGFYAQYLSYQYQLPLVMINPALQPALTLASYLGWQTNFYTEERYFFGENELAQLKHYDLTEPCQHMLPRLVLLDRGDELIDYRFAQQRYVDCAEVIDFPDGDHQFRHLPEAATAIRRFVGKMGLYP